MIPGTEAQADSQLWKNSRWFRVTAFRAKQAHNLGSVLNDTHTKIQTDATHRKLYNYMSCHVWDQHQFTTDTTYGIESEDQARSEYKLCMQASSPNISD